MSETTTLEVPGATLRYDVLEPEAGSTAPTLLTIGSPMDASGFAALAAHFPDRTVVTYDPRGVGRSQRADGATASTPEEHAEDLHRLIADLGTGPVDVFATSGAAVNALELVTRHPEQVQTLVAHEPPLATVLPDREEALAAVDHVHETYERFGFGPGMAKFIALTMIKGPIPAGFAAQQVDPAAFGLPTEDDGDRNHPMLGSHIVYVTHYEPDFEALRSAPTRIVAAAGAESEAGFTYRATLAVAESLGSDAAIFPSHHAGFVAGGPQPGDPEAFAARLREVLADHA
jgi:pimeloyl-ACP methyl ester carboxylesterase